MKTTLLNNEDIFSVHLQTNSRLRYLASKGKHKTEAEKNSGQEGAQEVSGLIYSSAASAKESNQALQGKRKPLSLFICISGERFPCGQSQPVMSLTLSVACLEKSGSDSNRQWP